VIRGAIVTSGHVDRTNLALGGFYAKDGAKPHVRAQQYLLVV